MILLRQRNFARRDYAGLDEKAKASLREDRRAIAEELLNRRKKILNQAAQKEHDYNKALDFINKNPNEWTGGANYEKLPLETQRQINKIATNNTTAEHEALNGWKERYNKVLGQAKDDANFDRQNALRDTERRAKLMENIKQPQAPTQNPTAPNSNPAPTKPQTPNKPGASSSPAAQKPSGFISKNMQRAGRLFKGTSRYGKAGQIAAIGTTALAAGGLGYGAYKAVKNKNKNNKNK